MIMDYQKLVDVLTKVVISVFVYIVVLNIIAPFLGLIFLLFLFLSGRQS